jgi:exodeoxyribonuclease V alpha subunit
MNKPIDFERDIDRALGQWVAQRAGSELLGHAASALGRAESLGHVRCDLAADAGFTSAQIAELRKHPWVGDGAAFTPFVAADDANLYTWRNWRNESRLAQALRARAQQRSLPIDGAQLAADMEELFAGTDAAATHWQRVAVAAVPGARVFVLAGGPGTGKTTTVLRMLLMLLRHAQACGFSARPVVALTAPTGKAAQRLTESIAAGRAAMSGGLDPAGAFAQALAGLADVQAQTLHRLLGYQPWSGDFAHRADAPLPADIVIVDEASMIDQAMMRQLVDALRPRATLILLGDPAQLYAIEAGSVLGDIVGGVPENALPESLAALFTSPLVGEVDARSAAGEGVAPKAPVAPSPQPLSRKGRGAQAQIRDEPLAGQVITLTHTWRAREGLRDALAAIRAGDAGWLDGVLGPEAAGDLRWSNCTKVAEVRERVRAWLREHAVWFANLLRRDIEPGDALRDLRRGQILCALREGPFGAATINAMIQRELSAQSGFDSNDDWHHGRPVIVTRNDSARGLFNGDVGIALEGADGQRVWFDGGASGPRGFSPRALPAHETAWAITVHRSQGSEYDEVAVLLPPDADNRILSRELLYTAVSRAREGAQVWSSADALRAAVARPVMRRSGLRERLTES